MKSYFHISIISEYCNKKIDEVTNLLKQTAEDCINSKDLCICEEALGRLLWSYGRDDEENFSKLLFNVKSLKHYCGLVNKSLTVINVENCDGDDEVREREQEIEKASPESFLFQAGYLTIEKKERKNKSVFLTLDYPNEEVKQSISRLFLKDIYKIDRYIPLGDNLWKAIKSLNEGNIDKIVEYR